MGNSSFKRLVASSRKQISCSTPSSGDCQQHMSTSFSCSNLTQQLPVWVHYTSVLWKPGPHCRLRAYAPILMLCVCVCVCSPWWQTVRIPEARTRPFWTASSRPVGFFEPVLADV